MSTTSKSLLDVDISKPRYDQNTYLGRAKHFSKVISPLNLFVSSKSLDNAKDIVTRHRRRQPLPEGLTLEELWSAKYLYDSAFHPDTGEKMILIGRMSAQMPMNLLITGGLVAFYKSNRALIFWQWINQSFNALVNYTNRSGDAPISNNHLLVCYVCAVSAALTTALGLNRLAKNSSTLASRLVPFAAVATANCVNIPLMRSQELIDGTPVYDHNDNKIGLSKAAARYGIMQVIFSRISMAAPGMIVIPFVMNHLEHRNSFHKIPWAAVPCEFILLGVFLTFTTPLACALFKQRAEIHYNSLETELKENIDKKFGKDHPRTLWYNKGL